PVGREQPLLRLAHADFPGVVEKLDAADAHLQHRIAELRILARHDQITRPGQHQAAGDALALHLRDRRLRDVAPALGHTNVDLLLARHAPFGAVAVEAAPGADHG